MYKFAMDLKDKKKFGVVTYDQEYGWETDTVYSTLEDAESRRKFLEAHSPGLVVKISDWSEV